jgi:NADH-quinone oxidoreductase subunit L
MHDEQDMKRMGNLRKWMPITAGTFVIGWLAIAGVPPFAGFWSKDDILLGAWADNKALWAIGLVTALLTAYYMSRQVFLVFFGKERFLHDVQTVAATTEHDVEVRGHPHESPWPMALPLVVLAGLSIVGGAINLPFSHDVEFLANWLEPVVGHHELDVAGSTKVALAAVATLAGLVGIAIAARVWLKGREAEQAMLEPALLRDAWHVDRAYATVIERPGRVLSDTLAGPVDRGVIDGAVNGLATVVRVASTHIRKLQTGYVRNYALGLAGGTVLLVAYAIFRVRF